MHLCVWLLYPVITVHNAQTLQHLSGGYLTLRDCLVKKILRFVSALKNITDDFRVSHLPPLPLVLSLFSPTELKLRKSSDILSLLTY